MDTTTAENKANAIVESIRVSLYQRNVDTGNPKVFLIHLGIHKTTWTILKRYSDMYALYKELEPIIHERVFFPQFPKRHLFGSHTEAKLNARKIKLTVWLNTIILDERLRTSEPFQTFIRTDLYLDSYQELKQVEKAHTHMRTVRDLQRRIVEKHSTGDVVIEKLTEMLENTRTNVARLGEIRDRNAQYIQRMEEIPMHEQYSKINMDSDDYVAYIRESFAFLNSVSLHHHP